MYTIYEDIKRYAPVLTLVKVLPRRLLSRLRVAFFAIALISGLGAVILYFLGLGLSSLLLGICLIFTGLWIEQILLFSYHNSYYFYGLNSIIGIDDKKISGATYEVAEAVSRDENDVTKAFCTSRLGTEVFNYHNNVAGFYGFIKKSDQGKFQRLFVTVSSKDTVGIQKNHLLVFYRTKRLAIFHATVDFHQQVNSPNSRFSDH